MLPSDAGSSSSRLTPSAAAPYSPSRSSSSGSARFLTVPLGNAMSYGDEPYSSRSITHLAQARASHHDRAARWEMGSDPGKGSDRPLSPLSVFAAPIIPVASLPKLFPMMITRHHSSRAALSPRSRAQPHETKTAKTGPRQRESDADESDDDDWSSGSEADGLCLVGPMGGASTKGSDDPQRPRKPLLLRSLGCSRTVCSSAIRLIRWSAFPLPSGSLQDRDMFELDPLSHVQLWEQVQLR